MTGRSTPLLVLVTALVVAALCPQRAAAQPWRIAEEIDAPDWLDFGATQRTRYERLWNQFRAGAPGDDMGLALRTTLWGEIHFAQVTFGAEMIDSRLYLEDDNTPVDNGLIDPLDLLQAYVAIGVLDLFRENSSAHLRVGRFTMDVGSRRLAARNNFRNTINAFTGLQIEWASAQQHTARAFATLPVHRLPDTEQDLRDNRIERDRESFARIFWGLFYTWHNLTDVPNLEAYLFGLHENDSGDTETRDRRLYTPGLRLYRAQHPGSFDIELEGAVQLGTSRASAQPSDTQDLDHRAYFAHLEIGYSSTLPSLPRISIQYDYASGDSDPGDATNDRFDTLYGARAFDYGPTSLYGPFARSNISSPGLRIEAIPRTNVDLLAGYRAVWLARARDGWIPTGVTDPTGDSGTFVGHQIQARLRWHPLPDNVTISIGVAHLFLGQFATTAPNANETGNPSYVYGELELEI